MDQREIFLAALEKEQSGARRQFVDEACGADASLRCEVEKLLEAHEKAQSFLEKPLVQLRDILAEPVHALAAPTSSPSAAKRVGVVEGAFPHFFDETAALLRRRLKILALAMCISRIAGILATLTYPGLGLRLLVTSVYGGAYLLTRSSAKLTYRQLRWIEFVCLLSFTVQAIYMPSTLMLERARAGDYATVIMDRYFVTGSWSVHLMAYALLIPNTWQRAAAILLPLSLLLDGSFAFLGWYEPKVHEAFASLHHGPPYMLPLVASFYGICFAHVMHSIRREAFRASRFGQYLLLERLGSGGMGVVYKAEHQLLKRPCAIKLIRPGIDVDAWALSRFEQEVRVTARLSHWNTVEIYDYGRTEEGEFYYVMELLVGMSLADLVEKHGPLPPERAVYLLRQVCAALREAHGLGLIHRDIKPANIFAAKRGGVDDVAKLLDFGLVKHSAGDPGGNREMGLISGSPPYMSPEQATPRGLVDVRSDIYSMGCLTYCLVTGAPPFKGETLQDFVSAHTRQPVVPPSLMRSAVPADLEQVILRCLEKKPGDRYRDVAALERALGECACACQWNSDLAARWWLERRSSAAAVIPVELGSRQEPSPADSRNSRTIRVVPPVTDRN